MSADIISTPCLIKEGLQILNICGINPTIETPWSNFRAITVVTGMIVVFIEINVGFFKNWQGLDSVAEFFHWFGYAHTLLKFIIMVYKRNEFASLTRTFSLLWSSKLFDQSFQKEIDGMITLATNVIIFCCVLGFLAISSMFARPLLYNSPKLAFEMNVIGDINIGYVFWTHYIFQFCSFITGFLGLVGFDILYCAFVAHLICQLRMIKKRFLILKENINREVSNRVILNNVYIIIQHHCVVLGVIKILNTTFSVLVAIQVISSVAFLGTALLGMVIKGLPHLSDLTTYIMFYITALGELFFYCLMGTMLTEESASVSTTVYESNWWIRPSTELRRAYLMVILRANQLEVLTAAGIFHYNMETFAKVLRVSFSYVTIANTVLMR